jgi:hypothetical protein
MEDVIGGRVMVVARDFISAPEPIKAPSPRATARAARGQLEDALDEASWPWLRGLSLWLDALLVLEEGGS